MDDKLLKKCKKEFGGLGHTSYQLIKQLECYKKADIWEHTVLGYGSLLGLCREGTMIGWGDMKVSFKDNDNDLIVLGDRITKEQEEALLVYLEEEGLFRYRKKIQRWPTDGRLFWHSIRAFPRGKSYKTCSWSQWPFKGYYWHCKGLGTLIKGVPANFLEPGITVKYLGAEIKIPKHPGACLDFWYPNWVQPKDNVKSSAIYLKVKDWADRDTWQIQ